MSPRPARPSTGSHVIDSTGGAANKSTRDVKLKRAMMISEKETSFLMLHNGLIREVKKLRIACMYLCACGRENSLLFLKKGKLWHSILFSNKSNTPTCCCHLGDEKKSNYNYALALIFLTHFGNGYSVLRLLYIYVIRLPPPPSMSATSWLSRKILAKILILAPIKLSGLENTAQKMERRQRRIRKMWRRQKKMRQARRRTKSKASSQRNEK